MKLLVDVVVAMLLVAVLDEVLEEWPFVLRYIVVSAFILGAAKVVLDRNQEDM